MRGLAIYGKGGIGKSTVVANLSVLFARGGARVLQFGCDPKADSAIAMVPENIVTVMDKWLEHGDGGLRREHVMMKGRYGVDCVEAGGPLPGTGCAGRAITKAFELIGDLGSLEEAYDLVLFDVLGDVVCGGFAAPVRLGYSEEVYIVTSGEARSLYAANNICWAIRQNARNGARLGGFIGNLRDVPNEERLLDNLARKLGTSVLIRIPRDDAVALAERADRPVVETAPESPASTALAELHARIARIKPEELCIPRPLGRQEFREGIQQGFE